ncbi:MAG: hypothetical protein QNJ17_00910 [Desulfocapsaceae bacterium]|nr:hypothetical protein [Desulfocapsaceae bacterium]
MPVKDGKNIIHSCKIAVLPEKIEGFTSLLQAGITLTCRAGTSVGAFLHDLPGFDLEYITERIQTIFLDGSAIDDLEQQLIEKEHVMALSAAMPGLAGAIFRKNSICAALRAQKKETGRDLQHHEEISVHLKLFNMIAREKGEGILGHGNVFNGKYLLEFFQTRPHLLDGIVNFSVDDKNIANTQYFGIFQPDEQYHLVVVQAAKQVAK